MSAKLASAVLLLSVAVAGCAQHPQNQVDPRQSYVDRFVDREAQRAGPGAHTTSPYLDKPGFYPSTPYARFITAGLADRAQ